MKKDKIIAIAVLIVTVVLTGVSFFLLPDTVVTQFSVGQGNVTTMPKLFAVALPFALGVGGAVVSLTAKNSAQKNKPLLVSAVGVVLFIIMLAVNL